MPPVPAVHVFLSSTWLDLRPEREAVEAVLQRFRETKYVGMEYFGSRNETTTEASLNEVGRSHVYVGIFGGRYGSGITEAEYHRARQQNLPCFVYFKSETQIPADARDHELERRDRLGALKEDLQRQHVVTQFASPDELATKIAADLHNWLFDTHLTAVLEQAAAGLVPVGEAEAILSAVRDLRAIGDDLLSRLAHVGVTVSGNRNVGAQSIRDSVIVTGDHSIVHQTVVQSYPNLRDYVYDFSDLIAATASWFVGRDFVFDSLTTFLAKSKCGYFRIVADAGVGKTALAAEIARRYAAAAFFANASSGLTRPDQCLNHLCGDLIARYALDHRHLPARAGEDSRFLAQLLAEAAARTTQSIVIVVDGLDEADDPGVGRNHLLLPDRLSEHAFIVVTHRPGIGPIATIAGTPVEELVIRADSAAQRQDIDRYLRQQLQRIKLHERLNGLSKESKADELIAMLAGASGGNFKYLDYVLADLAARGSEGAGFDLSRLPRGLEGYYAQFWTRMEVTGKADGWKEWTQLFKPVLALLAVAAEPVSVLWLATHVRRDYEEILERVLAPWTRFLSRESAGGRETWRIVHRSFAEFLADKLDPRAIHASVALYYQSESSRWEEHDGYPSRHLTWHLRQAREHRALFSVVDDEAWYRAQLAADISGSAFLGDVEQAWSSADEIVLNEPAGEARARGLGRAIRCALAMATMRSRSGQVPPELIQELMLAGLWAATQALAVLKQTPGDENKSRGIVGLAPHLPVGLLEEALHVAQGIEHDWHLIRAIEALAPRLTESLLVDSWRILTRLEDIAMRPDAARAVVRRLPSSMMPEVVRVALGDQFWFRVHGPAVLVGVAERLPHGVLTQVLEAILSREPSERQAHLLAELAPHLSDADRQRALDQALLALEGESCIGRQDALKAILPLLDHDRRTHAVDDAISAALEAKSLDSIAPLLCYVSPQRRAELWDAAVALPDPRDRSAALASFSRHTTGEFREMARREAWKAANEIGDKRHRAERLAAAFELMDDVSQRDAAKAVLEAAFAIGESSWTADALTRLAPFLDADAVRLALEQMREQPARRQHVSSMVALSRRLPRDERAKILQEAVGIRERLGDERSFAEALRPLLPFLPDAILHEQVGVVLDHTDPRDPDLPPFGFISDLHGDNRQRVLDEAVRRGVTQDDPFMSTFWLLALIPLLGAERPRVVDVAFNRADRVEPRACCVVAFARLLPWLPESSRSDAITRIQDDVESIVRNPSESSREITIRALLSAVPSLTDRSKHDVFTLVLETALSEQGTERWRLLEQLAPVFSAELFDRALRYVEEDATETLGANLWAILLPYLGVEQVETTLRGMRNLRRTFLKAGLLEIIGPYLRPPMVSEAFEMAMSFTEETYWAQAAAGMAGYLTPEQVDRALDRGRAMKTPAARAEALTALIPRLRVGREGVALEALSSARHIEMEHERASMLAAIRPWLRGDSAECAGREALDAAFSSQYHSPEILLTIAPHLSDSQIDRLLHDVARTFRGTEQSVLLRDLSVKGLPAGVGDGVRTRALLQALHALAYRNRRTLVLDLVALRDAVRAVGGAEAGTELALAIVETQRRWP